MIILAFIAFQEALLIWLLSNNDCLEPWNITIMPYSWGSFQDSWSETRSLLSLCWLLHMLKKVKMMAVILNCGYSLNAGNGLQWGVVKSSYCSLYWIFRRHCCYGFAKLLPRPFSLLFRTTFASPSSPQNTTLRPATLWSTYSHPGFFLPREDTTLHLITLSSSLVDSFAVIQHGCRKSEPSLGAGHRFWHHVSSHPLLIYTL